MAARVQREVLDGGRRTMEWSTQANGTRWRRVTDGNPCAFCAMLATRTDYRTPESAGTVVGAARGYGSARYKATGQLAYGGTMARGKRKGQDRRRGTRAIGDKYHDYCGCTVAEVIGDWEHTATEEGHRSLYDRALEKCEADGIAPSFKNVLSKMRELGTGIINDAHTPATQTGGAGGGGRSPRGRFQLSEGEGPREQWLPTSGAPGVTTRDATAYVQPHEEDLSERLASVGFSPHWLGRTEATGVKNPDLLMDGHVWEAKSPTGSGKNTISNQFSRAGKQSNRMVLDLRRTPINDAEAMAEIRWRLANSRHLIEVLVALKSGDIVRLTK